ncbi:hypothetical protein HGA88_02635 [Candidatus Roizmanbacteria bacterium]|nr:hypothetical protein [Candidatus Roizmanbacteria bacterium]
MAYHFLVQQILDLLKENNCWFETFEHEPVLTSEEAAKTRPEYTIHQGAKAILAKIERSDKTKSFVLFVIPGDLRFDSKKVKLSLNLKNVRFASEEELAEITHGVLRGAVPPFGNLFDIPVYVDKKVLENEKIVFNAGDRCFSVGMKSKDYEMLVRPQVVDIVVG